MQQPIDPTKYHVLNKKQKITILISTFIFSIIFFPVFGFWYFNFALNRPSQTDKEITFEIKSGQTLSDISNNLFNQEVINSKFLFNVYSIKSGLDKNMQAGIYTIPAGSSIKEIAQKFQHGTLDKKITFLEGWRVEEFARKASSEFSNVDYYDFIEYAQDLEGKLFPDTYIFNSSISAEQMVDHLNGLFENRTKDLLSKDYLDKSELSSEEVIIIASILERETSDLSDRPIVAGILIKRYKENMLVGADATTQYAVSNNKYPCNTQNLTCNINDNLQYLEIDWWNPNITIQDLNIEDAYNTRKLLGLPPAPISNPSLDSIKAVLNYVESDYYYYLNDASGKTHYAKDLQEHEQNIQDYLN